MSIDESKITQDQALNVLIQGVLRGQRNGAYTLAEAEIISRAIRLFTEQKKADESKAKASTVAKEPAVESNIKI